MAEATRRKRRLFLAIAVPEEVREALARFLRKHRKLAVRWVPAENFHATVLFLGPTDEERISELRKAVAGILLKGPPREGVRFTYVDWGPPKGQTRMIWLYGEGSSSWQSFKDALRRDLAGRGLYRGTDEWPFLPHVTVARMEPRPRSGLPAIATLLEAQFFPEELLVMESRLSPRGPNYSVLDRIVLPRKKLV